jgi:hypothetical protein
VKEVGDKEAAALEHTIDANEEKGCSHKSSL